MLKIVGVVNLVTDYKLPRAMRDWKPFLLTVDSACTITLTHDEEVASSMADIRQAPAGDVVLMNAHPAPVLWYGTLVLRVQCVDTRVWHELRVRDVAYVPASTLSLLSWSQMADQFKQDQGHDPPPLETHRNMVCLPLPGGEKVWGKRYKGLFALRCATAVRARAVGSAQPTEVVKQEPQQEQGAEQGAERRVARPRQQHDAARKHRAVNAYLLEAALARYLQEAEGEQGDEGKHDGVAAKHDVAAAAAQLLREMAHNQLHAEKAAAGAERKQHDDEAAAQLQEQTPLPETRTATARSCWPRRASFC